MLGKRVAKHALDAEPIAPRRNRGRHRDLTEGVVGIERKRTLPPPEWARARRASLSRDRAINRAVTA